MTKFITGQFVKVTAKGSFKDCNGFVAGKAKNMVDGWYAVALIGHPRNYVFKEDELQQEDERLVRLVLEQANAVKVEQGISPYHTRYIAKGVYGESTKILEEIEEFKDALVQQNPVLALCELSDVLGAIGGYVEKNYNITLQDLVKMSALNRKAFESGTRS